MISQTAEYALRAVVCLAGNAGRPMTTQQIADVTHVPLGYLSKVLQALGRARVVRSIRGTRGGFALPKSIESLSVLEVINAVDPIHRIDHCPLGLQAHGKNLCALHRKIDDAIALMERTFNEYTIADLLREPNKSTPMGIPAADLSRSLDENSLSTTKDTKHTKGRG